MRFGWSAQERDQYGNRKCAPEDERYARRRGLPVRRARVGNSPCELSGRLMAIWNMISLAKKMVCDVSDTLSWGRVRGPAEFATVPGIGTTVSFAIPGTPGVHLPDGFAAENRLRGLSTEC